MMTLLRRLYYLLNRRRFDEELANDLEFHREMSGREWHVPLGDTLRVREESRDAWGWTWIERCGQDLRYAARLLRTSPAFTLSALLMLAAGIGVNVAVFGFFSLIALQPLNVTEPDSLLRFHRRGVDQYAFSVPYQEAAFFREHARTLSAVIGVNRSSVFLEGERELQQSCFVTANFFSALGGGVQLGRVLHAERDEAPDAEPVVVLSDGFWRTHFGADRSIVGRSIRVNGQPATVVGVAAREFGGVGTGLNPPAFWAPIAQQPYFVKGSTLLTDWSVESPGVSLWGRLAPGQSAKAAEDELESLAAELRLQQPEAIWEGERLLSEPGGYAITMMAGTRRGTGAVVRRDPVYPVIGLVGTMTLLVLVVACGNLGSMLMARGVARQREISIRVAIGAGNGRLVRQLFTESLLLGLVGSAAGLALGATVLQGLLTATGSPAWMDATPGWRVATFALGMGFLSAILFGLTPALQIGRQRHRAHSARQILIGAQVAASCVLLIVAGLLARALNHATGSSPGFEYERVITMSPGLAENGYTAARARSYLEGMHERLRGISGVESVALALSPPLGRMTMTAVAQVDGRQVGFQMSHVSGEFFETMAIPVLRGRPLRTDERRVVVVSEALARQAWPGEDALGKSLELGDVFTVVGIVGHVRSLKFGETDTVQAYFPVEEHHWPSLTLLVKTADSPNALAGTVLTVARQVDPNLFPAVDLMSNAFRARLEGAEYSTLAVSSLGLLAQILACFGIIGVVSYSVSQRTREIGIRMALGAPPVRVLAVVLHHLTVPVSIGLAVGLLAAAGLSQVLRGRLYGLSHFDAGAYAGAIVLFLVTAVIAGAIPAQRALRVDPLQALRHE
ncbi:MAG: ABC transporter permease [Bryobacterales bacterium]|nr:ABC transporter permease [Bryobacterales bacterium]